MRTKEIAKEIRTTLKELNGVKLSVTSDYNHIQVNIMEAPFNVYINNDMESGSVNHYSYMNSESLTTEAKTVFQLVDEIILKYHWDKSDAMTDYFNCAFYYSYEIGKWDRPFILNN